jgi:diadenosine tetraphosphatase ApaH/serine/threonine PP2A family protein phosphatase
MRYGILGDIHANLSALETVLGCFESEGVDVAISVGDVVGYGAAPGACIELLREIEAVVVKGNHDAACIGELDDRYFNNYARDAVRWTRGVLKPAERTWLQALPMTATLEHCQVSHGDLAHPRDFNYVQSISDAEASLDVMERLVCFVGHTHVPLSLVRAQANPGRTAYAPDPELDLSEIERALVNVGSVGQPRDEEPRTCYAIYDSAQARIWIRRAEYDIDREAARIRAAGLPDMLADRLRLGV